MSTNTRTIEVRVQEGDIPLVEKGDLDTFVVAVRGKSGCIGCYAADYLNEFPLWLEPPEDAENCNATGWFEHLPGDNDEIVRPIRLENDQEIIGWISLDDIAAGLNAVMMVS